MSVRKIVLLGVLSAFAIVIAILESFIPSVGIPGVKLGLANIIILVTLYELGVWESCVVNLLRVFIASLVRGTIFTMGFFMSLSGAFLSLGIMILFCLLIKKFTVVGVSVIGSLFHVGGQILVAMIYLESVYIVYYLPIIGLSAIVTGIIVGFVAKLIIDTKIISKQIQTQSL